MNPGGFDMSTFMERMEENVKFNLIFPFHIYHDKLISDITFNKEYPDSYHYHSFEDVLNLAYREPKALYFTDSDKEYYSKQELEFIEKVQTEQSENVDKGMVIANFDLTDEAIDAVNQYKLMKGITFDQAIVELLTMAIENPQLLEKYKKAEENQ